MLFNPELVLENHWALNLALMGCIAYPSAILAKSASTYRWPLSTIATSILVYRLSGEAADYRNSKWSQAFDVPFPFPFGGPDGGGPRAYYRVESYSNIDGRVKKEVRVSTNGEEQVYSEEYDDISTPIITNTLSFDENGSSSFKESSYSTFGQPIQSNDRLPDTFDQFIVNKRDNE